MTTIAWNGHVVAVDSLVTAGSINVGSAEKVRTRGITAYALAGTAALFEPMIAWAEVEFALDKKPVAEGDDAETTLFVFRGNQCWMIKPKLPYLEEMTAPDAWGAGAEIAIGAMDAGASPERALEIACRRSVHTGGPVRSIDLRKLQA